MKKPEAGSRKADAAKAKRAKLSHVNRAGEATMVDVGTKLPTQRYARAEGRIRMSAMALRAIRSNAVKKGDVLGVARLAGIQAAKRTAELIPLCHPLPLTDIRAPDGLRHGQERGQGNGHRARASARKDRRQEWSVARAINPGRRSLRPTA